MEYNINILVTGGAGFIGSNIVEYLLDNGTKKVRILDNLSTGRKENIQFLLDKFKNLEFMYGDISNLETCRQATKDIDCICHQAALGSVPRSMIDPLSSHISNVNGFVNILISAKEANIKRVVYASSSAVYGDNPDLPKVEDKMGKVLSPYGATKLIDEIYANVFTKCYDMECIGLRYFNVFGPRQNPNGVYAAVIPKFIKMIKNNEQPLINGNGSFSRDFTYVDNIVQANILAITTTKSQCYGEAFNIGSAGQISLNKLVQRINECLNTNIQPIYGQERKGDIPHSNANIDKARKFLGYEPKVLFDEGIMKLVESFEKRNIIDIDYNKLLNRKPIITDCSSAKDILFDKKILITGGCGSIGSEIVRQLYKLNIKNIHVIDNSEQHLFFLKKEITDQNIHYYLADIMDVDSLESIFEQIKPNIVFHAAAYKHVLMMEDYPKESIKINIIGCKNVADLSLKHNVNTFIFVSTDKAVNPTNIMGTSKRISEIYINNLNSHKKTKFITTRFGNVLGSSGSVVLSFIKKINENKNLEVTHKEIIRYFMTIPEAAQLVIKSSVIGNYGEILMFDMGEPVKIIDLANNFLKYMCRTDLDIDIIGLKAGEKLHEELLCDGEKIIPTEDNKIMKLRHDDNINYDEFIINYAYLISNYKTMTIEEVKISLKKIVPEYNNEYLAGI